MEPVLWCQGDEAREFIVGRCGNERERGHARGGEACIFTRGHSEFAKCGKMGKRYGKLLETCFSLFFPNSMDGEGIWGTLEDALTSYLIIFYYLYFGVSFVFNRCKIIIIK
jgi:hypothetical protein